MNPDLERDIRRVADRIKREEILGTARTASDLDLSALQERLGALNGGVYHLRLGVVATDYAPALKRNLQDIRNYAGDIVAEATTLLKEIEDDS